MRIGIWVLLAAILPAVGGCVPLLVGGAAGAGLAAHDRRSIGAIVDDESIEMKGKHIILENRALREGTHIDVTSYNGIVLLTGEAQTPELRDQFVDAMRKIIAVRRISNEIQIAPPSSADARAHDAWLTSKVKARLLATKGVPGSQIKVVTSHDIVYLLGLVTHAEGGAATDATSQVSGIDRIVKLFEYLD